MRGYLVHAISRAPDFDQVVKVTLDKPVSRRELSFLVGPDFTPPRGR